MGEGVEVGKVREAAQQHHGHPHAAGRPGLALLAGQGHGIFLLNKNVAEVGQHAHHGHAGKLGELLPAVFKQPRIAAKLVDDNALDAGFFLGLQQGQRAEHATEHAAAVDVGNQIRGGPGVPGHAQVGNVAALQIQLRDAAGTLQHDGRVAGRQPVVGLRSGLK